MLINLYSLFEQLVHTHDASSEKLPIARDNHLKKLRDFIYQYNLKVQSLNTQICLPNQRHFCPKSCALQISSDYMDVLYNRKKYT